MDRLILENFRCFRKRQTIPLAPITLLVGENSTGKSTVLAAVRVAWELVWRNESFNEEPFLLGAYDQIESFPRPWGKGGMHFVLGVGLDLADERRGEFTGEFVAHRGQPRLATWRFEAAPVTIEMELGEDEKIEGLKLTNPSGTEAFGHDTFVNFDSRMPLSLMLQVFVLRPEGLEGLKRYRPIVELLEAMETAVGPRPHAFSPVRTRPKRTYDPIGEAVSPGGEHVPFVLASLSPEDGRLLLGELERFGRASGLFRTLNVNRLGQSEAAPFQLQAAIDKSSFNLLDVGYGISQALPILVDCIRGEKGRTFLLQQPEVHLHPRAQAELASFFVALAKSQAKRFVIETHSDAIVDRVRMDVRDKKHGLRPEDVSLLYFERTGDEVEVHRLDLDELGNITNAPPGYRSFFLEEERRLLGG